MIFYFDIQAGVRFLLQHPPIEMDEENIGTVKPVLMRVLVTIFLREIFKIARTFLLPKIWINVNFFLRDWQFKKSGRLLKKILICISDLYAPLIS